ncbi:Protein NRT1/ PTR FAMILY 8.2 [Hibiscus syriacus]|uniref:Protein NRT1/ PTR FAMILY 8.2 n=1 Tax=Hibiscus syriacus TaxID=106335 RepID=A0A6A2Z9M0_HIBSY|nr:Protein NRT1/ PTR FAMILY 8.2 [Hibiscus syriacus]
MTLLALSASVRGMRPRCSAEDYCNPTETQSAMAFLALYLIALGTGGLKPCVSSYGADQFDDTDEKEKKHKSSFFNWFYLSINICALIAASVLVWVQDNVSWGWGFGIPAIAMAIAVCFFFSGNLKLQHLQISLFYMRHKESNIKGSRKIDHTNDLSFFDKATVEIETDQLKGSTDGQLICVARRKNGYSCWSPKLPHPTGITFHLRHSSVIFWVPIYDRITVPVTRKFTGHKNGLTQLQRMGIGLFISIFSMLVAAILVQERLQMIKRHNYNELKEMPMTIFWQVPQYFLIGCTEVFTFIGQLEFFYEQAPDAMRSFCSALSLTTVALGSYLSSLLVTIVSNVTAKNRKPGWIPDNLNYGHIDYFFWLLAAFSVLNLGVYVWIAKWYTYKRAVGTLR